MSRTEPDPRADQLPPPRAVRGLFDLTGRVALVTGGASGLGRAISWGLACHGAHLVVADLDAGSAEHLARQVQGLGCRATAIGVDVSNEAQVEAMVEQVIDEHGRIDIAVNNAGNNCRKPTLDMSATEFDRVVDVHLRGTFLCARAAGRRMVAQREGKMINLASIMGHVGGPGIGPYAAAKGGILQLTKVLALEWAPYNVQVNALSPAHFDTPLTRQLTPEMRAAVVENNPQGRFAFPIEIVGAAVLLASPASSFITGTSILVDGGWTAR
jgi:NAD(P)-dependent dehydrogenase (short-subunit alcohol dehydrogenase family)